MYRPADYYSGSEDDDEYDNDGFDFYSPNVNIFAVSIKLYFSIKKICFRLKP